MSKFNEKRGELVSELDQISANMESLKRIWFEIGFRTNQLTRLNPNFDPDSDDKIIELKKLYNKKSSTNTFKI